MAITRDQVFEAAEALVGNGEEPTYITVRERLGSGSFSTISKYLREWKAAGKGKEEGAAHVEVPAEGSVLDLLKSGWGKVDKGAKFNQ